MTVQTTYSQEINKAFAGLIADLANSYVVSRVNPRVAPVETVTIDTVTNDAVYTVTANGVASSFTADASATEAEINAGLLAAIAAEAFMDSIATAVQGVDTSTIILTGVDASVQLTVTVSALLSVATTVPNNGPIQFGLFVAKSISVRAIQNLQDASSIIEGVLAHTHAHEPAPTRTPFSDEAAAVGNDDSGLQAGDLGDVMKIGAIWTRSEEVMLPTDPVFVRHTAGAGGSIIGSVRNDADTASAVAETRAHVVEHDPDTSLVLLQINIP